MDLEFVGDGYWWILNFWGWILTFWVVDLEIEFRGLAPVYRSGLIVGWFLTQNRLLITFFCQWQLTVPVELDLQTFINGTSASNSTVLFSIWACLVVG